MKDLFQALFRGDGIRVGRRSGAGSSGVRMIDVRLEVGNVCVKAGKILVGVSPVHVAQSHNVLTGEIDEIAAAHSAYTDASDIEKVARRSETTSEYMPGNDGDSSTRSSRGPTKPTARNFLFF